MFDKKAFRTAHYGVYVVASAADEQKAGCVVNTFVQLTSEPARASVAINKENFTCGVVQRAGRFTVSVLSEDAPMDLIGVFGFKSGRDIDKFADCVWSEDESGMPCVLDHAVARFSFRVIETVDVGTHILFIGEADEAETLSAEPPMSYAYYHQVKGGKTPPKASSFSDLALQQAEAEKAAEVAAQAEAGEGQPAAPRPARVGWECTICGHIEWVDELPEGYECPLCGMSPEYFERVEG